MANLKELMGDDLYKQVTEKLGDKVRIDVVNDGEWIPKDKFSAINTEKNSYKEQVGTLNTDLTKLQATLKDNQAASDTVESLKQQITAKESELAKIRKTNIITLEILKHNPNDMNDIIPQIKQDAVLIAEDGTVAGLTEQMKALVESKPYLFKAAPATGTGGSVGAGAKVSTTTPPASSDANTFVSVIKSAQSRRK